MDVAAYMTELGQQARAASREVARSSTAVRNQALLATAAALDAARSELATANSKDLERGREKPASCLPEYPTGDRSYR